MISRSKRWPLSRDDYVMRHEWSRITNRQRRWKEIRQFSRRRAKALKARLHLDATIEDLNFKAPATTASPISSTSSKSSTTLCPPRHPARQPGPRRAFARCRRRPRLRRRDPPQQRPRDHPQGRFHEETLRLPPPTFPRRSNAQRLPAPPPRPASSGRASVRTSTARRS